MDGAHTMAPTPRMEITMTKTTAHKAEKAESAPAPAGGKAA